jgi:hypothetical protein
VEKKTSDAQIRASRNWEDKNRERKRYMSKKSTAKSFIRLDATLQDLDELEQLIADRRHDIEQK